MNSRQTVLALVGLGALIFAAVGCGIPEDKYNKDIADLKAQLDDAQKANDAANKTIKELQDLNKQLSTTLVELGVNLDQLKDEAAASRKAADQAKARLETFRKMLEQFQAMIKSGKLRVRIVRGRMVVEMSSNILFESGKADLSKEGEDALAQVASVLSTITDRDFQVAGHTDNVAIKTKKFPSNWELSTERSVTVVKFFIEHGVPANHVSAAGYADTQPTETNDTDQGKALNRRIEIVLMPNLDELPDLSALEGMSKQ